MKFQRLFSPISLGALLLKNRLVMAPMLTNYSDRRGIVTPRHLAYYGARAAGGTGLIEVEGTAVHPGGRGFPLGLGCWEDSQTEGLSTLADAIHRGGGAAVLQLIHAGRQTTTALTEAQPVAPSPIPCPRMREMPKALSRDEIAELVEAFGQGARRAKEAGFDGVEIHGAHGYLVNQFLSSYSNHRTDEYGGDLPGRARFATEIIRRIRELTGADYPLLCRISADEYVDGGIKIDEGREIARLLQDAGLTAIHVSAGVYGCTPPSGHPHGTEFGVFSHLAREVKASVSIPVITVGRITRPSQAEKLLADGTADLVALGRAQIADPEWTSKAQHGHPEDIIVCTSCNACNQRTLRPDIVCLVNPRTGREGEQTAPPASVCKNVAVVGGGLPGLIAARIAAERGHRVVIYLQGSEPGGLLGLRGRIPHLSEWTESMDYQLRQAALAGAEVRPGASLTPDAIKSDRPDTVIVALPGPAVRPDTAGLAGSQTFSFDTALGGDADLGPSVAVLGGGIMGTEAAYFFASQGRDVTIIAPGPDLATDGHPSIRYYVLEWLKEYNIRVLTDTTLLDWNGLSMAVSRKGKTESLDGITSLVLALGYRPAEELEAEWKDAASDVYFLGDVYEAHQGIQVTSEAARIAAAI